MSLCNVWIEPTHALVGVDTEAGFDGGEKHSASKLHPIPHLNCVIAGQGVEFFFLNLHFNCHAAGLSSFDELLEVIARLASKALNDFVRTFHDTPEFKRLLAEPRGIENEFVLVGWSPQQDRMVGHLFVQDNGSFVGSEIDGMHVSPWIGLLETPLPSDPESMEELARAQVSWVKKDRPGFAIGGKLLLAELTRDRMTITQGCGL